MAIYVYRKSDGVLVSYCPEDTDPVASADVLAAKGLTVVTGVPKQSDTTVWDAKTQALVAAPAKPAPPAATGTLTINGVTYQLSLV